MDCNYLLIFIIISFSADQLSNEVVVLIDGRKPNQSHLIKELLERISVSMDSWEIVFHNE